jgi:plasmid stability protein
LSPYWFDEQAGDAYTACMQYTLRNIPPTLDEILRARAREQGKSLNDVAIEVLLVGLGLAGKPMKRRDLSDIAGSWAADPETDQALQDQRRIDPDLWR